MFDLSEAEISRRLRHNDHAGSADPLLEYPPVLDWGQGKPIPAAVLVPLLRQDSNWRILLTRRNAALPEHSGQVAFPGGRADPGDSSPEFTALREAQEEIGLKPEDVRLLGRLPDYFTITNYLVTPVVGVLPWPYPLHPAGDEVSRVFSIPLDWLADPANHEERLRDLGPPYPPIRIIYFQPYDGEVLWGASARITLAMLHMLKDDEPSLE